MLEVIWCSTSVRRLFVRCSDSTSLEQFTWRSVCVASERFFIIMVLFNQSIFFGDHSGPVVKVVLWSRGGAHLTKRGWSKPHTHSNPTNLALFRRKIALYRFNQGGSYYCRGAQMGAGGWAPPHFNHCSGPGRFPQSSPKEETFGISCTGFFTGQMPSFASTHQRYCVVVLSEVTSSILTFPC